MMMGYGTGWLGWLGLLIQLAVIVGVVYLIVYWISKDNTANKSSTNDAINIVRERFARGEISEEEYERMIKTLRNR